MKIPAIILIIIFILGSCKDDDSLEKYYHDRFFVTSDSLGMYSAKTHCAFLCGKQDSEEIYGSKFLLFLDSSKYYYNVLYPHGNPADTSISEDEQINCNCK